MNKKKLIILISIILCFATLVGAGIFALSESRASKIEDKLDLGEKYLEDLKYEKALAAYKEVLKIDPKNVDAYLGMAEVYIAMGEYKEALEILEEGYEETESRKLEKKIEEVEALMELEAKEPEEKVPSSSTDSSDNLNPEEGNTDEATELLIEMVEFYTEDCQDGFSQRAIVVGRNSDDAEVWRYETEEAPIGDAYPFQGIGICNNMFYLNEYGVLVTLDINTGEIVWRNEDTDLGMAGTFDDAGNLYVCSYWGIDLLIIDKYGNTIKKIYSLDDRYYWPYELEISGDYVYISYEGYDGQEYLEEYVLSYCLTDGTVGYGYDVLEPAPRFSGDYFGASYQDELHIEYRSDGTYLIDLTWLQLLELEDAEGYSKDGILHFYAEDSFNRGENHHGTIEWVDGMLLMTITDSTLEYAVGSTMYFTMSESGGNLFDMLPQKFSLISEEYMYDNTFRLYADSSFEGTYYRYAEDYSDVRFPNGTVYLCEYDGIFSNVTKLDDFIYTMQISSLNLMNTPYEAFYDEGYQFYYTEPYGLYTESDYIVFLPGASLKTYQDMNIEWEKIGGKTDTMPEKYYFIYNTSACVGFIGTTD